MTAFAYGHSGGGVAHLVTLLAHAALWSAVGRFIRHEPVVLVLLVVVAASLYLVRRRSSARLPVRRVRRR